MLVLLVLGGVVPHGASAQISNDKLQFDINVESERLGPALETLAKQAGVLVLYPFELAEETGINPVRGRLTIDEALSEMLRGSRFSGGLAESGVLTITLVDNTKQDGETKVGKRNLRSSLLTGASAFLFGYGAYAPLAVAQLDEIIVTATKRESAAQSTPIALSVASGDELRGAGIDSLDDISGFVPSLTTTNAGGVFVASIRGVSTLLATSGSAEAGVAIHQNGVYLGTLTGAGGTYFDVERVEVLRGPQGTLWGRNSTGGAINVIQKLPTEEFEGYVGLDFARFNTASVESAVSGPLSEKVQGRFALKYSHSDGYLENLAGDNDLGDDNSLFMRLSANVDIAPESTWLIAAGYGHRDINGYPLRQEGTGNLPGSFHLGLPFLGDGTLSFAELSYGPTTQRGEFETFVTNDASNEQFENFYVTSEANFGLGAVNLTLLTDYRRHQRSTFQDVDYTNQSVVEDFLYISEEVREFSQEIRLTDNQGGPLEWLIGGFYYHQDLTNFSDVEAGPYTGVPDFLSLLAMAPPGPFLPQAHVQFGADLEVRSYAAFGQATYDFTDQLAATFGMRYSYDKKSSDEFSLFEVDFFNGVITPLGTPGPRIPLAVAAGTFSENWDSLSGRAGLEFAPIDDVLLFANVARGYKSGGINIGSLTGPFDEEILWNYEAGVKSEFWNRRAQLNVTGFYNDFQDYQLASILGTAAIVTNVDAEVYGIEVEAKILPTDDIRINFVSSWNHSEITRYNDVGLLNPANNSPAIAGEPLPRTPEFAFRLAGEKDFVVSDDFVLTTGVGYRWQSQTNLDGFGTINAEEDAFGLLDAFLSLAANEGRWSVDVYGRNLTDKYYLTGSGFASANLGSFNSATVGQPRTFGGRLRANF